VKLFFRLPACLLAAPANARSEWQHDLPKPSYKNLSIQTCLSQVYIRHVEIVTTMLNQPTTTP
jgi:hypothetical protein